MQSIWSSRTGGDVQIPQQWWLQTVFSWCCYTNIPTPWPCQPVGSCSGWENLSMKFHTLVSHQALQLFPKVCQSPWYSDNPAPPASFADHGPQCLGGVCPATPKQCYSMTWHGELCFWTTWSLTGGPGPHSATCVSPKLKSNILFSPVRD